ncbi:MAG: pyridoxal-phosphate dependent enzyme [Deltaproteobacteria bacterium]|nr:pyridoxal-phosphate dependent enzyme [Deltaproteobacteria bacterium]
MEELKEYPVSISEAVRARSILREYVKPTQMLYYEGLSRLIGANVYVKHENHNPTGAFKIRGGTNLMYHLKQGGTKGVITFSTGNHGLSIATAARWFGLNAVIVVPKNNNPVKNRAIIECGAELVESGTTFEEASQTVDQLCQERSLYYAHPANEPLLINGVGTEFLEIIEDLPDIDVMIVPLGAGSEAAAAITTLRAFRQDMEVIAVQGKDSPAAYNSWKKKEICHAPNSTFAGGFATGKAYELPFGIYKDGLDDFVLLTEDEIYDAMGLALYYTHNLAEGAGASSIMAAYKIREKLKGKNVVLQMSGCNASPEEIKEACTRRSFYTGKPE